MKQYLSLIFLLLLLSMAAKAQLPINHSLYHENAYFINPAAIFQDDYLNIDLNSKMSYIGFDNAPFNNSISLRGPISERVGVGFSFQNATQGALTINDIKASYAYKVKFGKDHYLSLAFSLGFSLFNLDPNSLFVLDQDDPFITNSAYYKQKYLINEIGFLYKSKGFQLGVSAPYFTDTDYQNYIAYSSVNIGAKPGEGFTFTPGVLFQHLPTGVNNVSGTVKFGFKPAWAFYTFNSNANMILGMGVNFNNIKLAYSYEMNNNYLANIAHGNQEILLTFRLKNNEKSKIKVDPNQPTIETAEK